ncbi:ribonuclease 7 [Tupaia chinensis]|uniref:Ribonuclease 7 n=1 Tax=Tupaia chinensis TaxID=246437 RepID=L8YGF5_TUPCH|nr:ribonuclease 7 [Tupaia chinensis]ELV14130.1 Ribonuclease 7 [Tupaia chinensis]
MAPVRLGFCHLLLLLLLGLWVAEIPVSAKPKHVTSSQWFKIQHVQPSPEACNSAMDKINKETKRCKNLNTFLHKSFSNVAATCQNPVKTCKNKRKNCHKSRGPVSLTLCEHTSGKYPNCRYKEKHMKASYTVACDPPQKGDTRKFRLVPVHLEPL